MGRWFCRSQILICLLKLGVDSGLGFDDRRFLVEIKLPSLLSFFITQGLSNVSGGYPSIHSFALWINDCNCSQLLFRCYFGECWRVFLWHEGWSLSQIISWSKRGSWRGARFQNTSSKLFLLSFESELLGCPDSRVHRALSKNRWNSSRWQHFEIGSTSSICVGRSLNSYLRNFVSLYTFWLAKRQQLWLSCFHLIKLLLLFLITWILWLLRFHLFKYCFRKTYFLQPRRHFFFWKSSLFFLHFFELRLLLTERNTEKLSLAR